MMTLATQTDAIPVESLRQLVVNELARRGYSGASTKSAVAGQPIQEALIDEIYNNIKTVSSGADIPAISTGDPTKDADIRKYLTVATALYQATVAGN